MHNLVNTRKNSIYETKENLDYFKNLQNTKKELYDKLLGLTTSCSGYWFIDLQSDIFTCSCTDNISNIFKSNVENNAIEYYLQTFDKREIQQQKQKLTDIQIDLKSFDIYRDIIDTKNNVISIKESINYIPHKNMIVGIVQNLTQIKKIEKDISALDRIIQQFIKLFDKNIIIIKLKQDGTITYVSSAFSKVIGYTKEFIIGKHLSEFWSTDNKYNFSDIFNELNFKTLKPDDALQLSWQGEIKYKKKDNENFWLNVFISPITNHENNFLEYTIIGHDITINKKLEEFANYDALTGVYNRRYYSEIIQSEINRTKRDEKKISFVMIDIDFFKQYNDIYGHRKGDEALISVATTLKDSLKRGGDFIFRMGGEEFCVIFSDYDNEKSFEFCEELRKSIENLKIPHIGNTVSEYLSISLGLIVSDMKHEIIDELGLYTLSDNALYEAKKSGRNKTFMHQIDEIELF